MLDALRHLFCTEGKVAAEPADGKITLADVLAHGWFELWYQPKIELKTMRLYGAEALVRARHPQRGVIAARPVPARRQRGRHAGADRARHRHRAARLERLRRRRAGAEDRGQRAGFRAGQAADQHHGARGAPGGRELAGPDPGSDRGRGHPRPQACQRRRRRAQGRRAARWRSTISAPAIPRSRGSSSCRSAN